MLPRHRSAPTATATAAAQVQLHVRRVVLDNGLALGVPAAGLPLALQQAVAAELAGQRPPVNHVTPLHDLARSVNDHLQPALATARQANSAADGGRA
jgi:hypothetical protein